MNGYEAELKACARWLQEHDDYLVVSHVNPDGDAVGSVLAMAELLHLLGKSFVLVNEGSTPRRFHFLERAEDIVDLSVQQIDRKFTHVIALDCASFERIGTVRELLVDDVRLLNIDHHPTNSRYGDVHLVRADAASTTEILYDLVKQCYPRLMNRALAEPLYTGLLTDTGSFRYSNTNRQVMIAAADLLSHDLDPAAIATHALETASVEHIELLKRTLPSLQRHAEGKVALIKVTLADMQSSGAQDEDVEDLVSYPRRMEGVHVGVLLKEREHNEVKVSLRSNTDLDVSRVAQSFGGGGHAKAAGCTYTGPLVEAEQALLNRLYQELGDA
jgi:bifunctional oligoribonuclease and PAP phosphatase NrnA